MNKRRLFASAMAACMLLSTMPSTALAAGTTTTNDQSISQNQNAGANVTGPAAGGTQDGTGSDINAGGNTEVENTNKLPEPGEDAPENYRKAVTWYNNLVDAIDGGSISWKVISMSVYWCREAMKTEEITANETYKANLNKIKAYYGSITELDMHLVDVPH